MDEVHLTDDANAALVEEMAPMLLDWSAETGHPKPIIARGQSAMPYRIKQ